MIRKKRDIVSINDLTNAEIEEIFDLTDEYVEQMADKSARPEVPLRGRLHEADGFVLATLFYEASTRTRLSFESAMIRLGGQILGTSDPVNSSIIKGESIADTVRVIENYADLIVIRHKVSGAAHVAAEYAGIPIINGGDGSHEHPTQTLCDLYTLRRELAKDRQGLRDSTLLVVGDLKNGRTVHSLVYALARFGVNIITMPAGGLELPGAVTRRLEAEYGCRTLSGADISEITESHPYIDAVYVASSRNFEPDMFPDGFDGRLLAKGIWKRVDACYVTRLQDERLLEGEKLGSDYPIIDYQFLKGKQYRHTLVLHPLPRVDELSYELDSDPRALYFKQMAYSVPIRMALIAKVLGVRPFAQESERGAKSSHVICTQSDGMRCENTACVANLERRYLANKFVLVAGSPVALRCHYCDREALPRFIGNVRARTFLPLDGIASIDQLSSDVIFFSDEEQAKSAGFKPRTAANRSGNRHVA